MQSHNPYCPCVLVDVDFDTISYHGLCDPVEKHADSHSTGKQHDKPGDIAELRLFVSLAKL